MRWTSRTASARSNHSNTRGPSFKPAYASARATGGTSVQQQMRDFGVRRALGATSGDVLRLVAGNAARVIAAGAVAGLILSAILSRLLATILFGVQPLDPATFACVTIVLVLTAAASIAGPAWRATRVDPAVALRMIRD